VELDDAIRRRRMVRSFEDRPVPPGVVDAVLAHAVRAPSAGFSQGWAFVVLEGSEQTGVFWRAVTTPDWRASTRREGLLRAPVVVLPLAHPQAYLDRYAAPDKEGSGLDQADAWPVPYWLIDTGFATMLMLLSAADAGLGAVFVGIFRGEAELLAALGVPEGYRPIGAVALGYPAPDIPSPSVARGRRPMPDVVHRGRW
jgi:nitroreductase